ncbi:hypothetical protein OURE66S_00401 [Oligella ureolytica]
MSIQQIYASNTTSTSELKKNPMAVIKQEVFL